MVRVNLWGKVRYAKDSKLLSRFANGEDESEGTGKDSRFRRVVASRSFRNVLIPQPDSTSAGAVASKSFRNVLNAETDLPISSAALASRLTSPLGSPGPRRSLQSRDESTSLSVRAQQLRRAMDTARMGEEEEVVEGNADEFAFYACVNGIESDEEDALHEELDRIEAQVPPK
jgi:hypothetical protein